MMIIIVFPKTRLQAKASAMETSNWARFVSCVIHPIDVWTHQPHSTRRSKNTSLGSSKKAWAKKATGDNENLWDLLLKFVPGKRKVTRRLQPPLLSNSNTRKQMFSSKRPTYSGTTWEPLLAMLLSTYRPQRMQVAWNTATSPCKAEGNSYPRQVVLCKPICGLNFCDIEKTWLGLSS